MTRAVHVFVSKLEPGAVGNHTLTLQRVLRDAGLVSEVFALEFDERWADRGRPFADYGRAIPARSDDVLIYQYAIGSSLAESIQRFPGQLIVNSHTQTPPDLVGAWHPGVTHGVNWGMRQLEELGPISRMGIAVSEFNAAEMRAAGFRDVVVVPVFTRAEEAAPDPLVVSGRPTRGAQWLFVGRISPNKMQQRLMQALLWYRSVYDSEAVLTLVGSGMESRYGNALRRYAADLGLTGAVEFTESVSESALAAYYATADVFVCLSEHEGFCVPLLEAMRNGVPVVAKATSAIPETLGGAGVLLDSARPSIVAAAVHRVMTDADLRKLLIERGERRAEEFAPAAVAAAFLEALAPVLT